MDLFQFNDQKDSWKFSIFNSFHWKVQLSLPESHPFQISKPQNTGYQTLEQYFTIRQNRNQKQEKNLIGMKSYTLKKGLFEETM